MPTETTSLLPSNASGNSSSYYFLKSEGEGGVNSSVRDADGLEVIETIPQGSTEAEFASRPLVITKVSLEFHVLVISLFYSTVNDWNRNPTYRIFYFLRKLHYKIQAGPTPNLCTYFVGYQLVCSY